MTPTNRSSRAVPEHFIQQQANWWRAYKVWVSLQWTLGALATVSAAMAAALTRYASTFGLVAAASSAIVGVGNPQRYAYSRAHRLLSNARVAFECDDSVSIDTLVKAQ